MVAAATAVTAAGTAAGTEVMEVTEETKETAKTEFHRDEILSMRPYWNRNRVCYT